MREKPWNGQRFERRYLSSRSEESQPDMVARISGPEVDAGPICLLPGVIEAVQLNLCCGFDDGLTRESYII